MAPWIVHLRVAEHLLEKIAGLDAHYFAIGNVAPDSGFQDEDNQEFNPPYRVSHFCYDEGSPYPIVDLEFFQQHLADIPVEEQVGAEYSFLLGYFFHLVTDNLWCEQIDLPTREKFINQFDEDPEFIWQVKRDWYGLDLAYVRANPASFFWSTFLDAVYELDLLDFMPKKNIQRRVAGIKELYQRTDEEIEEWYGRRPDQYLSSEAYERFIEGTGRRLLEAYRRLSEADFHYDPNRSVLELDAG